MQNSNKDFLNDFLEGNWQGSYIAKASYGTFCDKLQLNFFKNEFEITYFDNEKIRSNAKGFF